MILLSLRNISFKIKRRILLNNINLDINKQEIIGFLGKSGSGKSTLFKILLGFYNKTTGDIFYNGEILKDMKRFKKKVGFVSQENSFYEKLTVLENLIFYSKVYKINKKEREERINFLLNLLNLTEAKNVISENLSGGMKRRLEFAIALIHEPEILLLDEPFTGLDIIIKENLWKLILDLREYGITILIISHDIYSLNRYVSRIIIIDEGKIVIDSLNNSTLRLDEIFINSVK